MTQTRSKSDIAAFLESLESGLCQFLLDYGYPAIPEFWESYDAAMLELREIAPVLELMRKHDTTWHELDRREWLLQFVGEVSELVLSENGKHRHPPELEMMQIAAIALNWLRLFSTNGRMKELLDLLNGVSYNGD